MRLLFEVIRLALSTVRSNKARSFLTVLGVVIGTGTIIGVGSILVGLDGAITGVIRSMGANTIIVSKVSLIGGIGRTPEERQRKPLTYENGLAIAERCPAVERVSPYLVPPQGPVGGGRAIYKGNDYFGTQIFGTTEAYASSGQGDIKIGRFFTDTEDRHRMPVAVIGEDVYTSLFGLEDPIGKRILVNGKELEVVGVLSRSAQSVIGQGDSRVVLPYFTMHKLFPQQQENLLMITPREGQAAAALDQIRVILRQERKVPFDKPDNFVVSTSDQLVEQFRSITSMVALVMVVMSSIGLLVGGIGVMNIMLVSVTERTREIGVRKAVGARRGDVIMQFLTEAVALTGMGGLLGVLLGWAVARGARIAFPSLPAEVPMWAVILGIGVSVAIGLFFGIWPASKAARLDPVEALRYE